MIELRKIIMELKQKNLIFFICFNYDFDYLQIHLNKEFYKKTDLITFKISYYSHKNFLEENEELINFLKGLNSKDSLWNECNKIEEKFVKKEMKELRISKELRKNVKDCLEMLRGIWLVK